ncbi:MAG: hypothetical protein BKPUNTRY_002569 [Candidatus Fervidibacter sp.]
MRWRSEPILWVWDGGSIIKRLTLLVPYLLRKVIGITISFAFMAVMFGTDVLPLSQVHHKVFPRNFSVTQFTTMVSLLTITMVSGFQPLLMVSFQ